MKRDLQDSEIIRARIRALQAIYYTEHSALCNWAKWSRDRAGIFPPGVTPPTMWAEALVSKFGDFADEKDMDGREIVEQTEAKAERADREEYDERAGEDLDQRIHNAHDFPAYQRDILKIAYVSREVPEDQFPRLAGCTEDTFCERLEGCLRFVSRHV